MCVRACVCVCPCVILCSLLATRTHSFGQQECASFKENLANMNLKVSIVDVNVLFASAAFQCICACFMNNDGGLI